MYTIPKLWIHTMNSSCLVFVSKVCMRQLFSTLVELLTKLVEIQYTIIYMQNKCKYNSYNLAYCLHTLCTQKTSSQFLTKLKLWCNPNYIINVLKFVDDFPDHVLSCCDFVTFCAMLIYVTYFEVLHIVILTVPWALILSGCQKMYYNHMIMLSRTTL